MSSEVSFPCSRRDILAGAAGFGTWVAFGPPSEAGQASGARGRQRPDVKILVFDTFGTVVDWRGTIIA
jgi:hypothetical protein